MAFPTGFFRRLSSVVLRFAVHCKAGGLQTTAHGHNPAREGILSIMKKF